MYIQLMLIHLVAAITVNFFLRQFISPAQGNKGMATTELASREQGQNHVCDIQKLLLSLLWHCIHWCQCIHLKI